MNLSKHTARYAIPAAAIAAVSTLAVAHPVSAAAPAAVDFRSVAGGPAKPLGALGPLTDLVIQRILVGDQVAASKFGTDSPIEDPVREAQVLEQVRAQADASGVDPDEAVRFFSDQITASKIVQQGLFDRWTSHPEEAPTTRPDLAEIREQLDRLTVALLDELERTQAVRGKPVSCAVQQSLANLTGAATEHLDALHRRALTEATHSVCRLGE